MAFSLQSLALALCCFGPGAVLVMHHVSVKSHTICLFIGSSFTYYLPLMLCSFFWFGIKLDYRLNIILFLINVSFQELARYFWFSLVRRVDFYVLNYLEKSNPYRHLKYAYICGIGYGLSSNVFQMSNTVRDLVGPGSPGLNSTNNGYFLIIIGSICITNFINQIMWCIIMYYGNLKNGYKAIIYVVLTHFGLCICNLGNHIKYGVILMVFSIVVTICNFLVVTYISPKFASYISDDINNNINDSNIPSNNNENIVLSPSINDL